MGVLGEDGYTVLGGLGVLGSVVANLFSVGWEFGVMGIMGIEWVL